MFTLAIFWGVALVYLLQASAMLYMRPANVAAIISVTSAVFIAPPALLYIYHDISGFYSFRNVLDATDFLGDRFLVANAMALVLIVLFSFSAAAWIMMFSFEPRRVRFISSARTPLMIVSLAIFLLWGYFLAKLSVASGQGISQIFIPSVDGERLQYYEHSVFMSLPLVGIVITMSCRHVSRPTLALFIIMGVLTCLTTHQRRELIVLAFTIFGAFIFLSDLDFKSVTRGTSKSVQQWRRKIICISLAICGALLPVAWYARVFSTNLMRGELINPFAIRNPLELLMGSPATGFPTFLLVHQYVERHGAQPEALLLQLLTAAIPRSIFPSKPESIDGHLVQEFSLSEIPSAFWFTELYYNYAYMAVFAAFIFGTSIAFGHQLFGASRRVIFRGIAVLLLANFVTIFKNGINIGVTRVAVTSIMLILVAMLMYMFGARSASQSGR